MLIYFVPLLLALLFYYQNYKSSTLEKQKSYFVLIFLSSIIYCGGYMTGSDWIEYELIYPTINWSNFMNSQYEVGFNIYVCIFKSFSLDFFTFLIISKILCFYSILNFFRKKCSNPYFVIFLYFGIAVLFVFVDNPFRFMLALTIVTYSYKFLINRKYLLFSIVVLLASSFHTSALIMFLFYPFKRIPLSNAWLIIIYLVFFVFLTPQVILYLIQSLGDNTFVKMVWYYLLKMENFDYSLIKIGNFFYLILFLIIISNRKIIEGNIPNGKIYFSMTIIFFFLFKIGGVIPTFFRFSYFCIPFLLISLNAIKHYSKFRKPIVYLLFSYVFLSTYSNVLNTWAYYPYSNYFVYMLKGEELSYIQRSNYNLNAFHKRTGHFP